MLMHGNTAWCAALSTAASTNIRTLYNSCYLVSGCCDRDVHALLNVCFHLS